VIDTPLLILKIDLEGIVKEKIFNEPNNPNSGVDSLAALMGASIQISSADTAFTLGSDIDGTFYAVLDTNTVYYFKASKPGYFITLDTLSTVGIVLNEQHPDTTLSKELVLEKIFTDQEIVLDDIYYDLDKAFIREDAKPTLNKLVDLLKRNPSINIQLSSHTDCQGGTSYNEKLSQRRAESAVQYLIQNGIDPIRLTARGYGESALAVECRCSDCTDDEHQQNRRTTFLVLGE
jgi:outer membrane protein OmpA-like peptidoglycan-associated protein